MARMLRKPTLRKVDREQQLPAPLGVLDGLQPLLCASTIGPTIALMARLVRDEIIHSGYRSRWSQQPTSPQVRPQFCQAASDAARDRSGWTTSESRSARAPRP
jgi:hypothetical protein